MVLFNGSLPNRRCRGDGKTQTVILEQTQMGIDGMLGAEQS